LNNILTCTVLDIAVLYILCGSTCLPAFVMQASALCMAQQVRLAVELCCTLLDIPNIARPA
jgi:hypothetical protein